MVYYNSEVPEVNLSASQGARDILVGICGIRTPGVDDARCSAMLPAKDVPKIPHILVRLDGHFGTGHDGLACFVLGPGSVAAK